MTNEKHDKRLFSFSYYHHIKDALSNHTLELHTVVIFILLDGSREVHLLHFQKIGTAARNFYTNTFSECYLFVHNNSFDPDSQHRSYYANKKIFESVAT